MLQKRMSIALILVSLMLVMMFSVVNVGPAVAQQTLTGDFYMGYGTSSRTIWEENYAQQIRVKVTVTRTGPGDYADTTPISCSVKTDNEREVLTRGQSCTIDDYTDSVKLFHYAGYDHNGYSYYGIGGTWEITLYGGGGGLMPGLPIGIILPIVAVVVIVIVVIIIVLRILPKFRESSGWKEWKGTGA